MEINYFSFVSSSWKRLESNQDLSPSHRALFWAIVHRWNQNFFREFEANRFDLMKLAGIKSEKTYFSLLSDLENSEWIKYNKGANHKSKSSIEVISTYVNITEVEEQEAEPTYVKNTEVEKATYVNITEVEDSTYVKTTEVEPTYVKSTYVEFTEVEGGYLGKNYLSLYNDTDISNTTVISDIENNNNITLKEKKEKKISEKKSKRKLETTFLESDIGNFEAFSDYIKNESAYSHANPKHYFEAVSEWRDKATGLEPKRLNWKLVVNQFFRNDISRNGRVVTSENHGSNSNYQTNRNKLSQVQPAELEKSVNNLLNQRAAIANNQTGIGGNRGHETNVVSDGKVFEF